MSQEDNPDANISKTLLTLLKNVTTYKNPFNIIGALPEQSNQEIRKLYKKVSLSCHPDRCNHPLADEAISCLSKAMKSIEDEDQRIKYTEIIEKARVELVNELKRKGMFDKIDTTSKDYRQMLVDKTEKIISETEENLQRAEKMRQANIKREKEELQHQEELKKLREEEEAEWENGRQQRVNNWRAFMTKKTNRGKDEHTPLKPPKTTLMN
ncbi:J domain-containing protein [Entamoeba marina]